MARAASKIPTLKHYIWSTLPGANSISQGQHPVPHMDAKATVDDYIRCELPGLLRKTTFMYVGFYGSNLLYPFWLPVLHPKLQTYMWLQPASADIVIPALGNLEVNLGPFVYATAVKSHLTLEGRRVLVSAEELPMKGLLERWGKATGKPTSYVTISGNDFVDMFGAFGEEVKITYDFWASAGFEKSWEIGTVVTREDLGLKAGKELVGWEESMRAINWNEVL